MSENEKFDAWWKTQTIGSLSPIHRMTAWNGWLARSQQQSDVSLPAWQPIETAPKDDTIILSDGGRVTPGGWIDEQFEDGSLIQSCGWWALDGGEITPTCWMPLPAPSNSPRSET